MNACHLFPAALSGEGVPFDFGSANSKDEERRAKSEKDCCNFFVLRSSLFALCILFAKIQRHTRLAITISRPQAIRYNPTIQLKGGIHVDR